MLEKLISSCKDRGVTFVRSTAHLCTEDAAVLELGDRLGGEVGLVEKAKAEMNPGFGEVAPGFEKFEDAISLMRKG